MLDLTVHNLIEVLFPLYWDLSSFLLPFKLCCQFPPNLLSSLLSIKCPVLHSSLLLSPWYLSSYNSICLHLVFYLFPCYIHFKIFIYFLREFWYGRLLSYTYTMKLNSSNLKVKINVPERVARRILHLMKHFLW